MSELDSEEYETFGFDKTGRDQPEAAVLLDEELDVDEEDEDLEDELEDAGDDEIDFVLAAYREDGQVLVQALNKDLANDLEELIVQLRRLPGDAGALGFVSLVEEVFVIAWVRGRNVQVLLSDGAAAADWPIARDVADLLDAEIPDADPDDEGEPMGDLGMLAELGLSDFDLGAILDDLELSSVQMLMQIAERLKMGPQFRRVAEAAFQS
ncbi:MAG TPA: tRNA adenosine deaminase-associated protein [Propionibacteriaceae bacterium]|nr:tRNA adenosine deaminase-associated protein [Propionibacteriaceae bacterium]